MRACCVRCESNLNTASGWHSDPHLTAGLALATDQASDETRPRVVALMYTMLLAGAKVNMNGTTVFAKDPRFTAAILIGAGSRVWGYDWIFYLVCVFAAGMVAAAFSIRRGDIDHELARANNPANSNAEEAAQHKPKLVYLNEDNTVERSTNTIPTQLAE